MRYFEIVKPSTKHILSDTDPTMKPPSKRWYEICWKLEKPHCHLAGADKPTKRQSRRQHLSPRRSQ